MPHLVRFDVTSVEDWRDRSTPILATEVSRAFIPPCTRRMSPVRAAALGPVALRKAGTLAANSIGRAASSVPKENIGVYRGACGSLLNCAAERTARRQCWRHSRGPQRLLMRPRPACGERAVLIVQQTRSGEGARPAPHPDLSAELSNMPSPRLRGEGAITCASISVEVALLRPREIPQIRRCLVFLRWHQLAIGRSDSSVPRRSEQACCIPSTRPTSRPAGGLDCECRLYLDVWLRQCVVDDGDLVIHLVGVGLVEIDSLLDDGMAVSMKRNSRGVVAPRQFHVPRLDLEHVVLAVAILVDPLADRVARESRARAPSANRGRRYRCGGRNCRCG